MVFAERFAGVLAHYARCTAAVTDLLLTFAQRAGGAAGARLARASGVPTSPDTLRRRLRRAAPDDAPTPFVLGVD
jgi:hypothetical protein